MEIVLTIAWFCFWIGVAVGTSQIWKMIDKGEGE